MKDFTSPLTRREAALGWALLLLHVFLLPDLLYLAALALGFDLRFDQLDLLYYIVSAALSVCLLRGFLRENGAIFRAAPLRSLMWVLRGFALMILLGLVASLLVGPFLPDGGPNEEALAEAQAVDPMGFFLSTVLLAPICEELLFRGVLFCTLRRRNRVLAHLITCLFFAFYHLWTSFVYAFEPILFLYLVPYTFLGFALTLSYEQSENIYCVILIHMLNNLLATAGG